MTGSPLVVVLGASGFVGSALLRQLAGRAVRVRAVARRPAPTDNPAQVEVRTADLSVPGELAEAVEGASAIVHLVAHTDSGWRVAEDNEDARSLNVGLAGELVDVLRARGGPPPAVLFAGADNQVGPTANERIDGSEPDRPDSPYSRQKLAAEDILKKATAEGVIRAATIRLSTVYGHVPGMYQANKGVVGTMVQRASRGEPLTMWHDGTVRRDLVHVDDVASAFVAALGHADELAGSHWLIGTGTGVRLRDLFGEIARIVARHNGKPPVPVVSVPAPVHAEPGDMRGVEIDSSAFRAVTGWRPNVSLSDGLARTVATLA